jgi:hypothetical protein
MQTNDIWLSGSKGSQDPDGKPRRLTALCESVDSHPDSERGLSGFFQAACHRSLSGCKSVAKFSGGLGECPLPGRRRRQVLLVLSFSGYGRNRAPL